MSDPRLDPLPLLLSFRSEASGRTLLIANEGDSVWGYLTDVGGSRPARDWSADGEAVAIALAGER